MLFFTLRDMYFHKMYIQATPTAKDTLRREIENTTHRKGIEILDQQISAIPPKFGNIDVLLCIFLYKNSAPSAALFGPPNLSDAVLVRPLPSITLGVQDRNIYRV